jgi:hypothetical protein
MNKYDELIYLIINRLLLYFGLRIVNNERIVFLYRIRNYNDPKCPEVPHVIRLTTDITKAFGFLNMDYKNYKEQHFETMLDFTNWLTSNCKYVTKEFIKSLEDEILAVSEDRRGEVHNNTLQFISTLKLGHTILKGFQYLPIIMYPNLREMIVRNYFDDEYVQDQFVNLKLEHLKGVELQNKFSPKLVINWIKPLRSNAELTGIFTTSFVNYITGNDTKLFLRLLIDVDVNVMKKEVLSYYYNLFPNSKAFKEYTAAHPELYEVKE